MRADIVVFSLEPGPIMLHKHLDTVQLDMVDQCQETWIMETRWEKLHAGNLSFFYQRIVIYATKANGMERIVYAIFY